jgi:hypothetical protein
VNIPGYDAWRQAGPEEPHQIGMEAGDVCARYPEPDEDAPRGYRPNPCWGEMINQDGLAVCDTCKEIVQ